MTAGASSTELSFPLREWLQVLDSLHGATTCRGSTGRVRACTWKHLQDSHVVLSLCSWSGAWRRISFGSSSIYKYGRESRACTGMSKLSISSWPSTSPFRSVESTDPLRSSACANPTAMRPDHIRTMAQSIRSGRSRRGIMMTSKADRSKNPHRTWCDPSVRTLYSCRLASGSQLRPTSPRHAPCARQA